LGERHCREKVLVGGDHFLMRRLGGNRTFGTENVSTRRNLSLPEVKEGNLAWRRDLTEEGSW